MKSIARAACVLTGLLLLAACAAGSADAHQMAQGSGLNQFLIGLWHGVIGPVTLVIEAINRFAPHATPWKEVRFFERDSGVLYDIGFYLGLVFGPSVLILRPRGGA